MSVVKVYLVAAATLVAISCGNTIPPTTTAITEDRARIIGGSPVHHGELKYQLSIRLLGQTHSCGASLVKVDNIQVAVSAAHCVMRRAPEQLTLLGGNLKRNGTDANEQERQVVDIVAHENFDLRQGPANDIALLFIDKPFVENEYVGTINLPKAGQETTGRVVLSGWGLHKAKVEQNEFGFVPSEVLQKVDVPVLDYSACKKSYSLLLDQFSDHFMCTGFMEEWSTLYKGSCIGDSGGPVRSLQGNYLAGVISFGKGCKETDYPAVNMKVSHFVDWINDEVRKYKRGGSSEEESKEEQERERKRQKS